MAENALAITEGRVLVTSAAARRNEPVASPRGTRGLIAESSGVSHRNLVGRNRSVTLGAARCEVEVM